MAACSAARRSPRTQCRSSRRLSFMLLMNIARAMFRKGHDSPAANAGQADQDGRPSGAALPSIDLSVVRGVGSSTVVSGSVGSYRPVIAGAKLREDATTILPRGRALQGVGLSSMRFHPIGGEPGNDEDGQEAWFTARIASLIG